MEFLYVLVAAALAGVGYLIWRRQKLMEDLRREMKILRQEILSVSLLSMTAPQKARHKKHVDKFNDMAALLNMERVPDFWEELGISIDEGEKVG